MNDPFSSAPYLSANVCARSLSREPTAAFFALRAHSTDCSRELLDDRSRRHNAPVHLRNRPANSFAYDLLYTIIAQPPRNVNVVL